MQGLLGGRTIKPPGREWSGSEGLNSVGIWIFVAIPASIADSSSSAVGSLGFRNSLPIIISTTLLLDSNPFTIPKRFDLFEPFLGNSIIRIEFDCSTEESFRFLYMPLTESESP
ncbi:MAG: hypothetical protein BWY89_02049 [Bacteroidetes bacterium ADurb.BinA012]|nr:MAG: hypothetical protein BWY89_02049 [Bacteroidetes bacterium ADurb.BinA012]